MFENPRNLAADLADKSTGLMSKIQLSDEESRMEGAPVGDLYAVEVLTDTELRPLNNAADVVKKLSSYSKDTPWSEQFAIVEGIRSLLLFHAEELNTTPKDKVITCVIDSLESLRSSSARNGIFAGGLLIKYGRLCREELHRVVQAMVMRTAGGPKFICDVAEGVLSEALLTIDPLLATESLMDGTQHKNADVVSKAYVIMGQSFTRVGVMTPERCAAHLRVIKSLFNGLNSKRVPGKESSRVAVRHLRKLIGDSEFARTVASCDLPNSLTKLIAKEVSDIISVSVAATACEGSGMVITAQDPVLVDSV